MARDDKGLDKRKDDHDQQPMKRDLNQVQTLEDIADLLIGSTVIGFLYGNPAYLHLRSMVGEEFVLSLAATPNVQMTADKATVSTMLGFSINPTPFSQFPK